VKAPDEHHRKATWAGYGRESRAAE
jgi:hypothetical protein